MNLNDIRRILALIIGKRIEEVRELTPDNFSAMLHYASLRYFHRRTGIPEEYQAGMPILRETVEIVRANGIHLHQFIVVKGDEGGSQPIYIDSAGYGDLPDDFYFPISLFYKRNVSGSYKTTPFEIHSNDDFVRKVDDVLEKATVKHPIATFNTIIRHSGNIQKLQIAPKSIQRVSMVYLKLPVQPYFAVKSEHGLNVYDADNSIELEWNDVAIHSIIGLMCESMGISIGAADVAQYQFNLNQQGK